MALALAISGAFGCGGTGERLTADTNGVTDAGLQVDPCNLTDTLEIHQFGCTPSYTQRCADFEGYPAGTGNLPTDWFEYIDQISPTAQFLPPSDTYTRMTVDDPDRIPHCGQGTIAYHMVSKGQNVWGPQVGQRFRAPAEGSMPPVDLDDFAGKTWEGMGFWIRKGTDYKELEPTGTSMFVSLRDPNTISSGNDSTPPCNDASNFDNMKCDAFGVGISFDTDWRYVMIPFDDLKQRGYGVHEDALDRTQIEFLYFSMDIGDAANGNWNVWLDDVVMYRHKD
jgi:hypothetical protein